MQGVAVPAAPASAALPVHGAALAGKEGSSEGRALCVCPELRPSPDLRCDRGVCLRDGAVVCQRDVLRHEDKCVRKIVS